MADQDETFLDRWSRRKRRGGATPVVTAEVDPSSPIPAAGPERTEGENTSPVAAADGAIADLPDVESLDKDSDYTGFLRDGVPELLKRKALRKLWRSDPTFAVLDGLNDYDEDFSLAFTDAVTKTVKTAYKVGKGWIDDDDEKAAEPAQVEGGVPVADKAGETAVDNGADEVAGVDDADSDGDEKPA